jgi:hypothetical protein
MIENRPRRHGPAAVLVLSIAILVLAACSGPGASTTSPPPPANSPSSGGGSLDQYDLVFAVAGDSRSEQAWMNYKATPAPDYGKYIDKAALNALNTALIDKRQGRSDFFFMHLGDFGIRGGTPVFAAFKQSMSPLKDAGIPMYPALGNHEVRYYKPACSSATKEADHAICAKKHGESHTMAQHGSPGGAEIYQNAIKGQQEYQAAFSAPWMMPADASFPEDYEKLAYTFKRGSTAFIVMDAYYVNDDENRYKKGYYTDFQLRWLQETLRRYKDDPTVKHRFVMSHQPVFNAGTGDASFYKRYNYPASARSGWILWALLDTYKVDAFFCGHSHFYHRWDVFGSKYARKYNKAKWDALGNKFSESNIKRYVDAGSSWETTIPHVLNGSCGAGIEKFTGNTVPAVTRAGVYNFSIVHVKGDAVTVDVYSYGDDKGLWTPKMLDKFRKQGGLVTTLPLQPEPT